MLPRSSNTDAFWQAFRRYAGLDHDNYVVGSFGDSPEMATELADLVVAGIKRATASLARDLRPFSRNLCNQGRINSNSSSGDNVVPGDSDAGIAAVGGRKRHRVDRSKLGAERNRQVARRLALRRRPETRSRSQC
jgi:hypothetical protein